MSRGNTNNRDRVYYPTLTSERSPLLDDTSSSSTAPPSYRSRPPSPPLPNYSSYRPPSPERGLKPYQPRSAFNRFKLAFIALILINLFAFTLINIHPAPHAPPDTPHPPPIPQRTVRVAIIGGGLSGVSTAHHLSLLSSPQTKFDITLFEKSPVLGGRAKSIDIPLPTTRPATIDVGAPGYHRTQDKQLAQLAASLNIHAVPGQRWLNMAGLSDWDLGIHNGQTMLYRRPASTPPGSNWPWWTSLTYFFRYGWAHKNLLDLISRVVVVVVVDGAPAAVRRAMEANCGDYLADETGKPILAPFPVEQIQPRLRHRYGANVGSASGWAGLEVMLRAETEGSDEVTVAGGLDRGLVEPLAYSIPNMTILKGREVLGVRKNDTTTAGNVTWTVAHAPFLRRNDEFLLEEGFDVVVLAAPHETLPDTFRWEPPQPALTERRRRGWEEMHVTILTSPHRLRPARFGLEEGDARGMPGRILTTLNDTEQRGEGYSTGFDGLGQGAKFWSVETVARVQGMYVYKLLSPRELENAALADILDGQELKTAGFIHRERWDRAFFAPVPQRVVEDVNEPPAPVDEYGLWYVGEREGMPGWEGLEGAVVAGRRVAEEIARPEARSKIAGLTRSVRKSHLL